MSKGGGDNTTQKQNLRSKSRNVKRRRKMNVCAKKEGEQKMEKKKGRKKVEKKGRREEKEERELLFFDKTCLFDKIRI